MRKFLTRLLGPLALVLAAVTVPAAAASAVPAYGPTGCSVSIIIQPTGPLHRDESFTVTIRSTCGAGVGFTVEIHSVTDTLGTLTTDSSGSASGSFVVPTNLPDGDHTVTVSSQFGSASSAPVVVSGGPFTGTSGSAPLPSGSSSELPFTGADITAGVGVAAGAVALGGLLVLTSRRRRSFQR